MGRLAGRGLPSRLRRRPDRLNRRGDAPAPSVQAGAKPHYHRWYYLARWRRLRWSVLTDALFTCAWCGRLEADTSKLVADHKAPHRGDPALFWDRDNLQCLCKACHDGDKQRQEAAARGEGG